MMTIMVIILSSTAIAEEMSWILLARSLRSLPQPTMSMVISSILTSPLPSRSSMLNISSLSASLPGPRTSRTSCLPVGRGETKRLVSETSSSSSCRSAQEGSLVYGFLSHRAKRRKKPPRQRLRRPLRLQSLGYDRVSVGGIGNVTACHIARDSTDRLHIRSCTLWLASRLEVVGADPGMLRTAVTLSPTLWTPPRTLLPRLMPLVSILARRSIKVSL